MVFRLENAINSLLSCLNDDDDDCGGLNFKQLIINFETKRTKFTERNT